LSFYDTCLSYLNSIILTTLIKGTLNKWAPVTTTCPQVADGEDGLQI